VFDLKLNEIEGDSSQNECANVGTSVSIGRRKAREQAGKSSNMDWLPEPWVSVWPPARSKQRCPHNGVACQWGHQINVHRNSDYIADQHLCVVIIG
jgi:hypothetical protein